MLKNFFCFGPRIRRGTQPERANRKIPLKLSRQLIFFVRTHDRVQIENNCVDSTLWRLLPNHNFVRELVRGIILFETFENLRIPRKKAIRAKAYF